MNALLIPIKIERNVTYRKNGNHLELTLAVPKPRKVETAGAHEQKEENEQEYEPWGAKVSTGEEWKPKCGLLPGTESGKRPEEEQEFEKMIDELESGKRSEKDKAVTIKIELPERQLNGSAAFTKETEWKFNRSDVNEIKAAQTLFAYLETVKGALATYLERKNMGAYLIHEREKPDVLAMREELERNGYVKHKYVTGEETHRKEYEAGKVKIESLSDKQKVLLNLLTLHLKETRHLQKSARSSK